MPQLLSLSFILESWSKLYEGSSYPLRTYMMWVRVCAKPAATQHFCVADIYEFYVYTVYTEPFHYSTSGAASIDLAFQLLLRNRGVKQHLPGAKIPGGLRLSLDKFLLRIL